MILTALDLLELPCYPSPPVQRTSSLAIMVFVSTSSRGSFWRSFNFIHAYLSSRCNSKPDCSDLSDEFDCKKIDPGFSYQNFIAPPPLRLNTTVKDVKITVAISADIISILDIDEIDSIFHVQFFLHLTWYDSRLKLYNLKTDTGLNTLSWLQAADNCADKMCSNCPSQHDQLLHQSL